MQTAFSCGRLLYKKAKVKISTSWLAQYVDLSNISNAALAHKLTMTGTNVETYSGKNLQFICCNSVAALQNSSSVCEMARSFNFNIVAVIMNCCKFLKKTNL